MPFDGREFGSDSLAVRKLDRVVDLLRDEGHWCKNQLRTADGKRCLLGALVDARARALSRGVLLAAKEVTGKSYARVESFNDDEATDHALVLSVLARTRDDLLLREAAPPRASGLLRRLAHAFSGWATFMAVGGPFGDCDGDNAA